MRYQAAFLFSFLITTVAHASSINQSTTWTIARPGTDATKPARVVGYGDSIFAGYNTDYFYVFLRSSPYILGEYASTVWASSVEVVRRTRSGAVAKEVYEDKIDGESSYMADASTRVVMFEMCGNDYLQAREAFAGQTGTCDTSGLDSALASCTTYMEKAMQKIIATAPASSIKLIGNIYYPSYAAEAVQTTCTDKTTNATVSMQDLFLGYLAHGNWRACHFAEQYAFGCIDSFANIMGSDYDSNGDGLIDSDGLRYKSGEAEADYVTRITTTLRSTIIDANTHFTDASTSYDYIFSDDVHPTPFTNATITLSYGGEGSGNGPPTFQDEQIVAGQNPEWNRFGHERFGWAASALAFPQAATTTPPTGTPPDQTTPPDSGDTGGTGSTSTGTTGDTGTTPATPDKTLGHTSGGCAAVDSSAVVGLMTAMAALARRRKR